MGETLRINRGLRYRLEPTRDQIEKFEQFAGVCRLVYNLAWEQRRDFWRQYKAAEGRSISFASQCRELTALRAEYDWIAAVPSTAAVYALRDLDRAFVNFMTRRARYPTPRRKGVRDGFRLQGRSTPTRILNAKWAEVRIPNLGWVKLRLTRPLRGKINNLQISRSGDHWYAAFSCEWETDRPTPSAESVGIDRGIVRTITLSTGEHRNAPDTAVLLKRRKRAQRVLARRKKGSRRYVAQRRKVGAIASKMARLRTDWCHRTSADIANRFGLVAIEALNIRGLTTSAAGTVEEPGKLVPQKRGLNRTILEQCWGKFATQLDYKLADRGGLLISVPAAYTSQTCAACGTVDARSRESQATFRCVHCGHTDNADRNAACEILRRSTASMGAEGWITAPLNRQPQGIAHA